MATLELASVAVLVDLYRPVGYGGNTAEDDGAVSLATGLVLPLTSCSDAPARTG